jgi:hypothetical protein
MSYALTQCNADVIGFYRSAEDAMQAVPGVCQWRHDQDRMGWDGWCADAPPHSPPDYQVTYLGSCGGGFTWREHERDRERAQDREHVPDAARARGAA